MHPVILQIGPISIRAYPLMLTLAFVVCTLLAAGRAKRYGILRRDVINLATISMIAAIVGSRVLYVLEHLTVFSERPLDMFRLWQGGQSYYGGLLLALAGGYVWLRKNKIPVGAMLDVFAPPMALGFFLVRIGCFLNGCCFGNPTELPWGVTFPLDSPAGWVYPHTRIHPVQLYASASGLIGFFLLLAAERTSPPFRGTGALFLAFLMLSSAWRFLVEFLRYQESRSLWIGPFTIAQAYAGGVFVVCVILCATAKRRSGRDTIKV